MVALASSSSPSLSSPCFLCVCSDKCVCVCVLCLWLMIRRGPAKVEKGCDGGVGGVGLHQHLELPASVVDS